MLDRLMHAVPDPDAAWAVETGSIANRTAKTATTMAGMNGRQANFAVRTVMGPPHQVEQRPGAADRRLAVYVNVDANRWPDKVRRRSGIHS
jgi:hypothetical protein